ncbi:MAG: succinate dehydrogenase [Phycisphaeraceae bacterium]|nr:MAG: succinate dehydrogenase [Phycisphaeraceae bacterium]
MNDGVLAIGGEEIGLGETRDLELAVAESFTGSPVSIPLRVWRAEQPGPTIFVTAAVHGDELNGAGVVREIILRNPFELKAGSLLLAPVVNVLGFERHSRYLPDRRDLNRCFPGRAEGSLASRLAYTVYNEIIMNSDYGIDLHTAAVRRTNFPNVRGDLRSDDVRRLAEAFGCEVIIDGAGPMKTLRRAACRAKRPTIVLEAGEVWKMEPHVIEWGVRGIRNALIMLGMVEGERSAPPYQAIVRKTTWLRAKVGGVLQFHVAPGDFVDEDQAIATNSSLLGREQNVIRSTSEGIVLGMTTLPAVAPGDPVCHVAIPEEGVAKLRRKIRGESDESLHERTRETLAAGMHVTEWEEQGEVESET